MKNAIVFVGLSVFSFVNGCDVSSNKFNDIDDQVIVEFPEKKETKMVDGLELVFVTEDGKMIFRRTSVPSNSMSMNEFTDYMQTKKSSSPIKMGNAK